MIDYMQESDRAGRNREMMISTVLVEKEVVERKMESGGLSVDRWAMGEFVVTRECRRRVMGEYLDGSGLAVGCEDLIGRVRCDGCGRE